MNVSQQADAIYNLAASPTFARDGRCYAARHSGLYRSDDEGRRWHAVYDEGTVLSVALSPDGATLFAGVVGGVLRSNDHGQSWQAAALATPPPLVVSLLPSPAYTTDGTVLAGTLEDGVFRSADRGRSWSGWNFGLLDLNVLCLAASPAYARDETLFAGTGSGLFRSTNGGRAWRETGFPSDRAPLLSLAPAHTGTDDWLGIVFAGTEGGELFRSTDGGQTWTMLVTTDEPVNRILLSSAYPREKHLLLALGEKLLFSVDGGASLTALDAGGPLDEGITTVLAPAGVEEGAPLLVGTAAGSLLTTRIGDAGSALIEML